MAINQTDTTRGKIRQRRLDRMRLGQAVCDYVTLPSDDEIRLCIVPLTEADYLQVLEKVRDVVARDDLPGMAIRDRTTAQEILVRSIREEHDLTVRVYDHVEDLLEDLEVQDVDEVYDAYMEMTARSSPSLDGIPDEELETVKKALQGNGLERAIWSVMVRTETLPFHSYALATPGQLTWVYLNQIIDYGERVRKIHVHCLPKFQQDRCEVCGEVVADLTQLPPEIQAEVYNPSVDGPVREFEVTVEKPGAFAQEIPEIDVEV